MNLPPLFREFPKRYGRNFAVQSSGTLAALVIPIIASPVITRLYSPAEYAVLAAYLLVVVLVSPISMMRYEAAIILPRRKGPALAVAALAMVCLLATGGLLAAIMVMFQHLVPNMVGEVSLGPWQLMAPVGVVSGGLTVLTQALALREGAYRQMAISRVVGAGLTSGVAILSGLIGLDSGALIVAQVAGAVGAVVALLPTLHRYFRLVRPAISTSRLVGTAHRFRRFPLISMPSDFLGSLATQGHLLGTSLLFGSAALGAITLGQRIVGASSGVFGKAIGEVFRREAARQWNENGDFHQFYLGTLMWMAIVAAVIYTPLLVLGPWLFRLVFGPEWEVAGRYVSILSPYFAMQFLGGNLGYTTYIVERQDVDLYIQAAMLCATGLALACGAGTHSIDIFLLTLTGSMCLIYSTYIFVCFRLSRGRRSTTAV